MNQLLAFLKSIDLVISRITRFICIVSMMIIFVMFLLNVLVRFVPVYNFTQTDEWTQLFLVWVIFLGAQELVRTRGHFIVDVITDRIAGTPAGKICRIISTVIEAIMYATICYYGFVLVERAESYMLTITWLQKRYFYLVIPVSAFFMTCYSIRDVVQALSMPWNAPKQAQNQA
ncbi:MAG: TRAP transporter small permease subunit [Succinivibrio sp.]|nr:TRAP transporter small permease subunit [Succinivibrio sp.]